LRERFEREVRSVVEREIKREKIGERLLVAMREGLCERLRE
jgi:hypothetical protein